MGRFEPEIFNIHVVTAVDQMYTQHVIEIDIDSSLSFSGPLPEVGGLSLPTGSQTPLSLSASLPPSLPLPGSTPPRTRYHIVASFFFFFRTIYLPFLQLRSTSKDETITDKIAFVFSKISNATLVPSLGSPPRW